MNSEFAPFSGIILVDGYYFPPSPNTLSSTLSLYMYVQ